MRALVTGAATGIGRATAIALGRAGFDVAIHFREHRTEATELVTRLAADGRESFSIGADLSQASGARELASRFRGQWSELDVLVHNAGTYPRRAFEEISEPELDAVFQTHLFSPMRLTRELLPLLRKSEAGRIIFVSSMLAYVGSRHGAHYAAAKAAQLGLARSLALELGPSITVNVVAPGTIDTAVLATYSAADRKRRAEELPAGRIGTADDVAQAIVFLASGGSAYVTGSTIHVDGGATRR